MWFSCRRAAGWTAFLALALIAHAEHALAQPTQAQQSAIRSNCRSDFMSNCSSVKPGGMEALQCLQRNMGKLSSGCKSAVSALSPPPAAAPKTAPPKMTAPAAAPAAPPPAATAAPKAPTAPKAPAVAATPPAKAAPPPHQPARTATPAPAPATAKPTSQQQAAIKRSCQSDFMAKCRGVQPGGADALHCLQRHSSQLSGGCRNALAALGGSRAPAAPAAARSAPPAAATAAAPADAAPPMPTPEQQSAIRFTCRADFRTLCRGVPLGGPEALACLQSNVTRLTPGCRTSIAALTDDQAATVTPSPALAPIPNRPFEGPVRRAIRDRLEGR
jgi:hypothetical protein